MPDNVKLLFTVRDLVFAIVNVALVAGAVIVSLLTVVAVAAPNVGVTNVGEVANTASPVPVSSLSAPARPAELVKVFCLLATDAVAAASAYAVVASFVLLSEAVCVTPTVPVGRVTVPCKCWRGKVCF